MAVYDAPRNPAAPARSLPRRSPLAAMLVAVVFVTSAALLPVVQSSTATELGYEMRQLEQRRSDIEADIQTAQTEIATLGSRERIIREARENLKMLPPEEIPAGKLLSVNVRQAGPDSRVLPARYLPPEPAVTPAPAKSSWLNRLRAAFVR